MSSRIQIYKLQVNTEATSYFNSRVAEKFRWSHKIYVQNLLGEISFANLWKCMEIHLSIMYGNSTNNCKFSCENSVKKKM